ncbi:hypothetical protein ACP6PF_20125, partial [Klebsiella pneumoniae]
MSSTLEKIQRQIAENPILFYIKGSPKLPPCPPPPPPRPPPPPLP